MRGTTWIVAASVLAMPGCGGDDNSSDQGPSTGNVTIKTHPGLRVDFMRAADDSIISSNTTDANGDVSETIDRGDRAVIIAGLGTAAPRVAVIDGLLAEREYRWLFGYSYLTFGGTATAVSWPAVAGASFYMIDSRCGGTYDAGVSETMASVSLRTDGDAILISAIGDRVGRTLISSAFQEVPAASVGQPLAITAPFMPGRELTLTLANSGATMMRDAFATLVVASGVSIELQPNLDSATTAKVSLPSMAGTLRTHVMGFKPTGALVTASDQRPMTDAVTLDLDGRMPDIDIMTDPTYDAATATINWTIIGTGNSRCGARGVERQSVLGDRALRGPVDAPFSLAERRAGEVAGRAADAFECGGIRRDRVGTRQPLRRRRIVHLQHVGSVLRELIAATVTSPITDGGAG